LLNVPSERPIKKKKKTHLSANWTSSGILSLVGEVLHGGSHEAVRSEQVSLQALKKG
jgi:hypothetical protein